MPNLRSLGGVSVCEPTDRETSARTVRFALQGKQGDGVTPQELAHWRGHFAHLEGIDVAELRGLTQIAALPAGFLGFDERFTDGLEDQITFIEWLRAEARYMCELGEVLA